MARKGERLSAETRAKITGRPRSEHVTAATIHQVLIAEFPKVGACEDCGKVGKTDYAFLWHPKEHTRNPDDYVELCRSCHFKFDEPVVKRGRIMNANKTREQNQEAGRKGASIRWAAQREMIANG